MALYVDSAYLQDIREAMETVPLAGVTTNPSILLSAHERGQILSPESVLSELLQSQGGLVFMQSGATDEEEMYQQALAYTQAAPERVIPKIPMTHIGMRVARRLKHEGRRIAFTAVTSVAQVYCAAMIQADFVIPYYNRLERSDVDASERIAQMAELLHNQHLPTRILTASIKSPEEAISALLAGSHDLTAAPAIVLDMVRDPFSEEAVEKFTQDWQKLKKL
jgi:TalC/MipB family fructose-6-phosphate aldolase